MTPFTPFTRDVTLGEPIDELDVHQGDQFYLDLNLYDDLGNAWPDSHTATVFIFMSPDDMYSGSGSFIQQFSGTTISGTASILFLDTATQTPGDYIAQIILTSGSGASGSEVTAGEFHFLVIGD